MTASSHIPRFLRPVIDESLADTRVVAVVGPRQAGKSTLVRGVVDSIAGATYVTLDSRESREAAKADPDDFVADRPGLLAIDEVQRVPDLLLSIKQVVDRDPQPGQYLLTGSSRLSANRAVAETLAGRIERLTLWPLSQGEIAGREERFIDRLLAGEIPNTFESDIDKRGYLERCFAGGFPEALGRSGRRRSAWFDSYVQTVIEREAPGVSASPSTAELPRLLRLVAARHAGLLNVSDLAADAQLARTTVHRYLDILEAVFLIVRLPAWSSNLTQREIRAPKVLIADPGLAAHLRNADLDELIHPETSRGNEGALIEGFVAAEVLRQSAWAQTPVRLSHYRDREKREVDLVIEGRGRVAAIEVKAGKGGDAASLRGLTRLRDQLGDDFAAGVILHSGREGRRLGDRLYGLPISALWEL